MALLLVFEAQPVAVIAHKDNPTCAEIATFRTAVEAWLTTALGQLIFMNPNHGFNRALPNVPHNNATQQTHLDRLNELRTYVSILFPIYTHAYATIARAMAAGNQPPPVPPALCPRPPKTKLPDYFSRKSQALARHFIRQCINFITINDFPDPETEVWWALQLMEGEAAHWRDEQLQKYNRVIVPAYLHDWDLFIAHFNDRWTDPHEGEKAMDRIMNKNIIQRTSVKAYNDTFNEALALTTETGANLMVLRAYETGLKIGV
jgi:hypothetical protein